MLQLWCSQFQADKGSPCFHDDVSYVVYIMWYILQVWWCYLRRDMLSWFLGCDVVCRKLTWIVVDAWDVCRATASRDMFAWRLIRNVSEEFKDRWICLQICQSAIKVFCGSGHVCLLYRSWNCVWTRSCYFLVKILQTVQYVECRWVGIGIKQILKIQFEF